ncbi:MULTISPECIES: hypothetical protein [Streptomyces]|uniref:Uncharacterized protein n=1 Tax=Streptomyces koelreuteriae TaxID=2838015 RepID=A0ABX8FXQ6_9ACTN|nr:MULTISPECIES: hypothetical protein [Streptomyces]QWB26023.1 hypothetical protein KJK29_27615 [Streptomyces koelreuteriae]UUA09095.1 hypothetical protein NNW98_27775 [Streptomyces koelreuteriae]UUA16700.1 hypothetical protein NNW99_27660 [Streptomyces sp. CRCS-T-1]
MSATAADISLYSPVCTLAQQRRHQGLHRECRQTGPFELRKNLPAL